MLQDPYNGAQRSVYFQQAFDLKPWGNTNTYHYSERSTILASHMLQPPAIRALSCYAASFFPKRRSSADACAFSEVSHEAALCLTHAIIFHHSS